MILHVKMCESEAADFCQLCREHGVDRIILEPDLFFRMLSIALSERWTDHRRRRMPLRIRVFTAKGIKFIHSEYKDTRFNFN